MAEKYDVVALGEYLVDFSPSGCGKMDNPLYEMNPGGAPTNCLAACSALGGKTAIIGAVGDDLFGAFLKRKAADANIDISGLQTVQTNTTLVFVSVDETGNREFAFVRDPGADTQIDAEKMVISLIDNARYFHFGTLSLTDEPARSATICAVRYAKQRGVRISFDPNYRAPLWKNETEAIKWMCWGLEQADLVKIAEEELQMLFGKDIDTGAKEALSFGVQELYVTAGSRGAYFYSHSERCYDKGFSVEAVDTTGCGDAFTGAILYQNCRESGRSAAERLRFANAVGALCAVRLGGMSSMPDMKLVAHMLENGV